MKLEVLPEAAGGGDGSEAVESVDDWPGLDFPKALPFGPGDAAVAPSIVAPVVGESMVAAVVGIPSVEVVGFVVSLAVFVGWVGAGTEEVVLLSALGVDVLIKMIVLVVSSLDVEVLPFIVVTVEEAGVGNFVGGAFVVVVTSFKTVVEGAFVVVLISSVVVVGEAVDSV